MISTSQATAALIAKKLTETEGVQYDVVKEPKGYRVVQIGKKYLAPDQLKQVTDAIMAGDKKTIQQIADANGGLHFSPKTQTSNPVNLHTNTDAPKPGVQKIADKLVTTAEQVAPTAYTYTVTCELRKETATMIQATIAGQPRAFDKKHLYGWAVEKANGDNPASVTMKMSELQAKKWKLLTK
jgi:hypothetical protein